MNEILVFARHLFADLPAEGAWLITGLPRQGQWRPRAVVEQDERWLQPIPYLLITDEQNRFWCYRRSGGDRRLADRFSCGVGGHVERIDQREELADTLAGALRRELAEELRQGVGLDPGPPLGWLYEGHSAIGRAHIGVIHRTRWPFADEPRPVPGEALASLGFLPAGRILDDPRFELWSRLAVRFLLEETT